MHQRQKDKILTLYDAEVRVNSVDSPGIKVVRDVSVTRLQGAFNFICCWKFSEDSAQQVVSQQANHFRQLDEELIWRVYGHDKPTNIEACLEQEGFIASPSGTLMVLPLEGELPLDHAHDIRRVNSVAGLKDYMSVAEAAFGSVDATQFGYYSKILSEPNFALFCGYANNEPVTSGRLEMLWGTSFGLMFGGGVSPTHRGKGYYRALVKVRELVARQRGLKYLSTEAQETSRPILEKLGFIPLVQETTWILPSKLQTAAP
ncbi:MAG: GNAT superfamily N-acetyltransferase [Planctomycetaceae bacterium]|jgi:GNAT superfamily N-acetyltransferase